MPRIDIREDRKALTITFDQAKPNPVVAKHTTEEVENLLNEVGLARSALLPQIPEAWDVTATVKAERDPRWFLGSDQLAGDALLHLRDRHFGWRHYVFTKSEARKLGEALIAQANAEPPTASGTA
jgi:hypothetical protein